MHGITEITTFEDWLGRDNTIGLDIANRKYRHNNESFSGWLDRVSGGDAKVKQLIAEKKFLFGGRILANRGLHKHGLKITYSNCYVASPPEDNIESIFDCAKNLARTFSYGGGVGLDISSLAPRGARLNNAAKQTTGSVSFMDLYSLITSLIAQEGRRGALMVSLDCDHPDLEEFIDVKSDLNKATSANISIKITDEFMQAVRDETEFTLSYTREATGEEVKKKVDARKVFRRLAEMNWDYAEPGILFWDRIGKWNLLSETKDFKYAGTNPCVSGDTLILTDDGYVRVDTVTDREVSVWNGYEFSTVRPKITGRNQDMKLITFSDGNELKCTHYHKFILHDGDRVEASLLKPGQKLVKHFFPIINTGADVDDKIAYTQGFFMGDGSRESGRDRLSIKLYGEKRNVKGRLSYDKDTYCPSFDGDFLTLPFLTDVYNKEFVPDTAYSVKSRLSWLAGYIDSDGTLQSADGGLSISSVNRGVLMRVKFMLNTLGCNGTVSQMKEGKERLLPKNDGTGEAAMYECKDCHRLTISATNVCRLVRLGLSLSRVKTMADPNRDASRFICVESISNIGQLDTVYCFNEEKNQSAIFNGVITAQCGEEPLPAGGSCLLGSINLSEFVSDGEFNYDMLGEAVDIAVRALNDVLDEGLPLHPLQEQRDSVRDWRQIGLGILGLADCLIKMGITYGSQKSLDICSRIAACMTGKAIEASARLAEEFGKYPKCDIDSVLSTDFFKMHAEAAKELVAKHGLRNSQLLTCAPTGTLSTMLGVSGGIEPIFANYYTRKTKTLHGKDVDYKIYTPIVEKYMKANDIQDDSELPEFFITSRELDYRARVDMQAVWQEHIDASISSTVNLPNQATVEDVENLYMYAWERELKGITVYRDGCKRAGILTTETSEPEGAPAKRFDYIEPVSKDWLGETYGVNVKRKIACGNLYINACKDKDGNLVEMFVNTGKGGICQSNINAISRLTSTALRGGISVMEVADQLKGIVCPACTVASAKGEKLSGRSCADAISEVLLYEYNNGETSRKDSTVNACAECGEELKVEGGCVVCVSCGWSHCG